MLPLPHSSTVGPLIIRQNFHKGCICKVQASLYLPSRPEDTACLLQCRMQNSQLQKHFNKASYWSKVTVFKETSSPFHHMPNLSLVLVDLLRAQTLMMRTSYRPAPSSSQRSLLRGWCSTRAAQKSPGCGNMTRPSLPLGTCTISVKKQDGKMHKKRTSAVK